METWSDYYAHAGDEPDALLVKAVTEFAANRTSALDLGAGNLRNAHYLLASGFTRVLALDKEKDVQDLPRKSGVDLVIADLTTYTPEAQSFDLCAACNVFFFLSADAIRICIDRLRVSLANRGLLVFNALGERDSWTSRPDTALFSAEAFGSLCATFTVVLQDEYEYDFPATSTKRSKHWHVRRSILQK